MNVALQSPPREIADLDRADILSGFREQFELPAGVIYLDGNSPGALPRRTRERIASVVAHEWGEDLITSWNDADWISLPQSAASPSRWGPLHRSRRPELPGARVGAGQPARQAIPSPLYLRYADIWHAVMRMADILRHDMA